jgi:uncharacterized damage-inducible protein DinB
VTRDDIHLLYAFDRWANSRVFRAVEGLTPEQFTRDLGGAFASVRDTLLHIVAGEWVWLEYWRAPAPDAEFIAELRTRRMALFDPPDFPDVAALRSKWMAVEQEQRAFIDGQTEESLARLVPFRHTQVPLSQLMQHVVNHSTYHRGQIALMLRQLKAEPLTTDFHEFLAEGPTAG